MLAKGEIISTPWGCGDKKAGEQLVEAVGRREIRSCKLRKTGGKHHGKKI